MAEHITALELEYNLLEHGWANFHLRCCGKEVSVGDFSYTTDALGDLVRAAISILGGARQITIRLDGEPIETRLILDQANQTDINLRILSFDDIYRPVPEEAGALIFEANINRLAFARAIQNAAHHVLTAHGLEGYLNSRSYHDFPLTDLEALDLALSKSTEA